MPRPDISSDHRGPFLSAPAFREGSRPALAPGQTIGQFTIRELLGSGANGDVYLATDTAWGEDVAIKIVDVGPSAHEALAEQIRQEKRIYSRVRDHRHVLTVHGIHQVAWGGTELLILAMEHADGGTFRAWLQRNRSDWRLRLTQGITHFHGICQGVAACHGAGIIHLDLKPENAALVQGVAKIMDFGLAMFFDRLARSASGATPNSPGRAGCGTPEYMSPERIAAPDATVLDGRADIWGLGVILYETVHPRGRPPFRCGAEYIRERVLDAPPEPLPEAVGHLARVVTRCLEKDPSERYQSVDELLDDLDGNRAAAPVQGKHKVAASDGTDAVWQQALQAYQRGHLQDAQCLCDQFLQKLPGHAGAQAMLRELEDRHARADHLYGEISRGMDSLGLGEHVAMLQEAIRVFPNHRSGMPVQIRLQFRAHHHWRSVREGLAAACRRDFETAKSHLDRASELNPNDVETEGALNCVRGILQRVASDRERIDQAVRAGNRNRALELARRLDAYLNRVTALLRQAEARQSS